MLIVVVLIHVYLIHVLRATVYDKLQKKKKKKKKKHNIFIGFIEDLFGFVMHHLLLCNIICCKNLCFIAMVVTF